MRFRPGFSLLSIILFMTSFYPVRASGDEIHLKSGVILRGKVTRETFRTVFIDPYNPGKHTFFTPGKVVIPLEDIKSIHYSKTGVTKEYNETYKPYWKFSADSGVLFQTILNNKMGIFYSIEIGFGITPFRWLTLQSNITIATTSSGKTLYTVNDHYDTVKSHRVELDMGTIESCFSLIRGDTWKLEAGVGFGFAALDFMTKNDVEGNTLFSSNYAAGIYFVKKIELLSSFCVKAKYHIVDFDNRGGSDVSGNFLGLYVGLVFNF